ncbi:MAG: FIST C-terminal domain-containing protein [Candidatus Omnitrophica bacterium]|nr:FIST C-terminal domain-containing protein [Candidatus Omnitrophota bacterium]
MGLQIGIGSGKGQSPFNIGRQAAREAISAMRRPLPHQGIAFTFASSRYAPEDLLRGIKTVLGAVPVIGATTAGELSPKGVDSDTCIVMCLFSDNLNISIGLGEECGRNSRAAGHHCAHAANKALLEQIKKYSVSGRERLCFIALFDGLRGNGSNIIRGIQEALGTSFPIVGGAAADDFYFNETKQFYDSAVYTDSVAGVLFGGELSIGIGARHGWRPLGKTMTVSQSMDNIVMEIDGRPAAKIYEHYFENEVRLIGKEPLTKLAILYPVGMSIPGEEEFLIRHPMNIKQNGAMVFAGEVPEGSAVRLMMGSRESALESAKLAALEAKNNLAGAEPRFLIVFDSASRRRLLGREAPKEIEAIRSVFNDIPFVGFCTYGEFAPLKSELHAGTSYFHNESIVILAVGS